MCEFLLFENRFFPSRFQAVKPKSCFCFRFLGFSLPVCPAFKDKRWWKLRQFLPPPGHPPSASGPARYLKNPRCATPSPSWMWRSEEVRTAHWDANVSTWGNVASDRSLQITSANPTWGPRTKKAWWWESDKPVSGQRSRPFMNLSGHFKYDVILIFGISSLLIFIELIQQEGSSFMTLTMNILHYCDQLLTCSKKVEEIKAQSKQQLCRWEWRHKSQFPA